VCARIWRLQIHQCEREYSRQIEEREKREKKIVAENEWETHELFYAFSMLIIVKKRREEKEKERNQRERAKQKRRASNRRKKYFQRKERETKSSGNVYRCGVCTKKMHTNTYSCYLYHIFLHELPHARSLACSRTTKHCE
jgi:hypothetical protein